MNEQQLLSFLWFFVNNFLLVHGQFSSYKANLVIRLIFIIRT